MLNRKCGQTPCYQCFCAPPQQEYHCRAENIGENFYSFLLLCSTNIQIPILHLVATNSIHFTFSLLVILLLCYFLDHLCRVCHCHLSPINLWKLSFGKSSWRGFGFCVILPLTNITPELHEDSFFFFKGKDKTPEEEMFVLIALQWRTPASPFKQKVQIFPWQRRMCYSAQEIKS